MLRQIAPVFFSPALSSRRHHQASLPTGLPKSTSSCKFSGLIPLRSSESVYSLCGTGSMTMRPDSSRTSTESSKRSLAARRTAAGIRTEALLPHFLTTAFIGGHRLLVETFYQHQVINQKPE